MQGSTLYKSIKIRALLHVASILDSMTTSTRTDWILCFAHSAGDRTACACAHLGVLFCCTVRARGRCSLVAKRASLCASLVMQYLIHVLLYVCSAVAVVSSQLQLRDVVTSIQ